MNVLTARSVAAPATGLCLGAVIRMAERVQKEEILTILFSTLAGERMMRYGETLP
jgi:hypothetical protein